MDVAVNVADGRLRLGSELYTRWGQSVYHANHTAAKTPPLTCLVHGDLRPYLGAHAHEEEVHPGVMATES